MIKAAPHMTPEQVEAFGEELDALRQRVLDDLGERDVDYIRNVIRAQRALEVAGRGLLFLSILPPAWLGGVGALSLSKILDNMEIGHNVMHGQYDWTGDPTLSGKEFEWDTACPADQWRHSHNYMHHTFTNIVGKDRDIGYGILRMSEEQEWEPYYLGNPIYATFLALFFQYGVALHDLEIEQVRTGKYDWSDRREMASSIWRKVRRQSLKDYVLFPLLAGPQAPLVLAGDATANLVRNVWAFMIIFCGHFPDGTEEFTEEEAENETRGELVPAPAARVLQPHRRQALPHPVGQSELPDRAPSVPGHPRAPLRGDLRRGARDLRALRHRLPHGSAAEAVRHGRAQDRAPGAPRRSGPAVRLRGDAREGGRAVARGQGRGGQAPGDAAARRVQADPGPGEDEGQVRDDGQGEAARRRRRHGRRSPPRRLTPGPTGRWRP